jgi:hypothetical protein
LLNVKPNTGVKIEFFPSISPDHRPGSPHERPDRPYYNFKSLCGFGSRPLAAD